jgi:hypothetical protein
VTADINPALLASLACDLSRCPDVRFRICNTVGQDAS